MSRPVRQAKRRCLQPVIGILPSEEAALQKALYASLYWDKKQAAAEHDTPTPALEGNLRTSSTKRLKVNPPKLTINRKLQNTAEHSIISPTLSTASNISSLSNTSSDSQPWSPRQAAKPKPKKKKSTLGTKCKGLPKKNIVSTLRSCRPKKIVALKLKQLPAPIVKGKRKISPTITSSKKQSGTNVDLPKAKLKPQETFKRRTKLLACAVRKKARLVADEPRDGPGSTVNEILKIVAQLGQDRINLKQLKASSCKVNSTKSIGKVNSTKSIGKVNNTKSMTPTKTVVDSKTKSPSRSPKSPPSPKSQTSKCRAQHSPASESCDVPKYSPKPVSCVTPISTGVDDGVNDSELESKGQRSSERHSPNSSYQAQRKFASNHTPPARPSYQEQVSPQELNETPKTEDFINFLCLRGGLGVPEHYHKFDLPWTPSKERSRGSKGGNGRKSTSGNRERCSALTNAVAKRLDFSS